MKIHSISGSREGFSVLETTGRSQLAVMTLGAGECSSEAPNRHEAGDQTLIVLEGELCAEVNGEKAGMKAGDAVVVPAGTPHKFANTGAGRAVTVSVYTPPVY